MQKYITNAFFALMSFLGSYGISLLKETNARIAAIEQTTHQLDTRAEVQKEINENLQFAAKDNESRLRTLERCVRCGG